MDAPGGFKYAASNESETGTVTVTRLPAIDAIVRSMLMTVPALIQVCFSPFRSSRSMPMKWIHLSVTGRWMRMASPVLNPATELTVNDVAPDGTYESAIAA